MESSLPMQVDQAPSNASGQGIREGFPRTESRGRGTGASNRRRRRDSQTRDAIGLHARVRGTIRGSGRGRSRGRAQRERESPQFMSREEELRAERELDEAFDRMGHAWFSEAQYDALISQGAMPWGDGAEWQDDL